MLSYCLKCRKNTESKNPVYKMNSIVNKFLLAGDKFMPQMRLTPILPSYLKLDKSG